jgi:ribose-phosphate pyrophosphokinase
MCKEGVGLMIILNGKEVEFSTFPNGETLFKKDGLKKQPYNMISFKYENDSDLIKLMFLKNYLDNYSIRNNLTIYYMPYSRMDRSEDGSPFTLKYVANFINNLKFDYVEVIEPHSDVTCAVLDRSGARMVNYKLFDMVMEEVGFNPQEDYIVYPDAGAQKRYKFNLFPNILVGHKERDFATGHIKQLEIVGEKDKEGGKAIIVDDLSSKGGTFVLTAEVLKVIRKFDEVYLLVAHAEDSIFQGTLFTSTYQDKPLIDKVFTTNTILDSKWSHDWSRAKYGDKLKVYDIEEVLSNN